MGKFIDHSNERFGRLIATSYLGNRKWKCKCDCGNVSIVKTYNLITGHTKSCGCLGKENLESFKKQYERKGRLYKIWSHMKDRCYNPNNIHSKDYKGRGIEVCEQWKNDYVAFYEWSMMNGYTDKMTIDRIDYDGDYCPENCRWVDWTVQQNNKRNNVYLTYNNETHSLADWARIIGMNQRKLRSRITRGWDIERAFTTP